MISGAPRFFPVASTGNFVGWHGGRQRTSELPLSSLPRLQGAGIPNPAGWRGADANTPHYYCSERIKGKENDCIVPLPPSNHPVCFSWPHIWRVARQHDRTVCARLLTRATSGWSPLPHAPHPLLQHLPLPPRGAAPQNAAPGRRGEEAVRHGDGGVISPCTAHQTIRCAHPGNSGLPLPQNTRTQQKIPRTPCVSFTCRTQTLCRPSSRACGTPLQSPWSG